MFNFILAANTITSDELKKIADPVINICEVIVPVMLAVVGALGAIWCVLLGVKYAKAEDPQEHEKAKKALVHAVVGFVLIFVLLVCLELGVKFFENWYENYSIT